MMDGLATDLRLAVRSLRRAPGMAAAAVVVLALGIGANATVFTALKSAVLTPLPYPDADRLVLVDVTAQRDGRDGERSMPWSYPKFQVLREARDRGVDPVAGYAMRNVTWSDPGDPEQMDAEIVSPDYFGVLGVPMALGRGFGPDEDDPGSTPLVVVLSHELWQTRFGGGPDVIGRTATVNGRTLEIVGVAPAGFDGLSGGARAWLPMLASAELFNRFMLHGAQAHWFHVVGRLSTGMDIEEARERITAVGEAVDEAHPDSDPSWDYGASARLLTTVAVNERAITSVWLLSSAALLVLLVACANLSGLLLARARRRARDGALRLAIGASRWRLVRASLAESAVLAGSGGLAAILVSFWGTKGLAALWPRQFLSSANHEMRVMSLESLGVDGTVLVFSIAVTLLATVAFGLGPALRSSSADLGQALKEGGGATRRSRGHRGLDGRTVLVSTQIGLALVLMVGTGLVGSSMMRMLSVDRGFNEDNVLVFTYGIPRTSGRFADPIPFHDELSERIARLPGVESVAQGCAPLRGHCWGITRVDAVEGRDAIPQGEGPEIGINMVGDDYFETLGVEVLAGRTLGPEDGHDGSPTMVVNRRAAEGLFPGENAVGRRIEIGVSADGKDSMVEIVGVVDDILYDAPDQPQIAEAYYSYREFGDASVTVLVRTAGDPLETVPLIRAELARMDPDMALSGVTTLRQAVARSVGDRRIIFTLLATFALLTVVLSATGTWGIVSHSVVDRRRELGLRLALGARRSGVVSLVLGGSVRSAVLGLLAGTVVALVGARLLTVFLYETSQRDPLAYVGGALLLLAVVLVASYVPARRATRVDPVEALRAE